MPLVLLLIAGAGIAALVAHARKQEDAQRARIAEREQPQLAAAIDPLMLQQGPPVRKVGDWTPNTSRSRYRG